MKKFFIIFGVFASLVLLVSCTGKKKVTAKFADDLVWNEQKGEYEFEKGAELTLWTDNEAFAEKVIALWKAKYPDVPLKWENVGSVDVAEKLKLDGPAGLGGDVFFIPHNSIVDLREAGLLFEFHDRDAQYIKNIMLESSYTVTLYNGKMYAAPSSVENIALLYNKQILADLPACETTHPNGQDAENLLQQVEGEKIYLEDLLQCVANRGNKLPNDIPYAADRFEDVTNGVISEAENKHTLLAWQLYDAYHNYPFLTKYGYRVFGPTNNDPTKFNITDDAVKRSIADFTGTWYGNKDGSQLFPGLAKIEDMGWDQSVARFQKGQVAMTFSGPWAIGDIINNYFPKWLEEGKMGVTENTKIYDIFGVTAIPKFSNNVNPTTFSGVQVTGMNIYTDYPNAAMNLIRFLVSDEIMREVYLTLGKIPAVADSSKIPGLKDDPISQGFLEQSEFSHAMPVIQEGNYMWDPLRDVWTYIFNEKMTIEEAQQESASDYQKKLEDAGRN